MYKSGIFFSVAIVTKNGRQTGLKNEEMVFLDKSVASKTINREFDSSTADNHNLTLKMF